MINYNLKCWRPGDKVEKVTVGELKAGDRFKDLAEDSNCHSKIMVVADKYSFFNGKLVAFRLHDREGDDPVYYENDSELVELVK